MAAGNQPLDHAIVVGGSLAGLLTARVLSDHARHVTILERDPVHDHPESRKGQPHTRHIHGLLAAGQQTMQHYFPDLFDALAAGGAFVGDMGQTMNWYTHGGYRKPFPSGIIATTVSRPFLEYLLRQRVRALPNVTLRDNCAVRRLLTTPDHTRVTGVLLERRDGTAEPEALHAALVVDCSGRGSRTPAWLAELGYPAPPLTEVRVDVGYASRLYRRDPADLRGMQWTLITPEAPREQRFAGMFPIDGSRWIVSMGGWGGDYCPGDDAGFLAYARALPAPDIYDLISRAEPLSAIVAHKFPGSLRRHYEQLDRFPAGLLVLGDAVSSFNPTYGQGMTSAALQARALDRVLRDQPSPPAFAPAFFRAAAQVVDIPWQLAVGEDFRFPTTQGDKPRGTDFINRYVSRVHRASHHDPVTGLAFLRVMNLLAPPTSLFHPRYLWRVLRYSRAPTPAPPNHPALSRPHPA
jgi:2-polyprenyl-6-methoxyphenol hydroxylase-like FAD-dependent oxidoreductase